MTSPHPLRIGVFGAGAVGCYVGGRLLADGGDVILCGRPRLQAEVQAAGLTLTDLAGHSQPISPAALRYVTDPAALADRDVILCCVKGAATSAAAAQLAAVVPEATLWVSLQNGVHNAERLRQGLPGRPVLGGIVGFNAVQGDGGRFRQATSGPLVIQRSSDGRLAALVRALRRAGLATAVAADIQAQQWTKLLMNLNNALGALSDVPTRDLLFTSGYRSIVAAVLDEALRVLRRAGQRTRRLGPLPIQLFPLLLRLPTPILRVVARAQLRIDPTARSSMWQDLQRRRPTEVEDLNGEIVRLAGRCGTTAPLNQRIVALVHEAEQAGRGSPALSAQALWAALTSR